MSPTPSRRRAGFTMIELLIGLTLASIVMLAVLLSYVGLARNFTRTLGLSKTNTPPLQAQSLRTLADFTRDARMATGLSGTPSASTLTLTLPTGTGTKNICYYFNSTTSDATVTLVTYSTVVPAKALVRVDGSNGATQVLHVGLLTCTFNYFDTSGNPYASYTNYLNGIKQVALTLTSQAGSSTNGTLTQVYQANTPRVLLRNRALLP